MACQQAALLGTGTFSRRFMSVPPLQASKQVRRRPTYPVARPDESRRFGGCLKSSWSANAVVGPITFLSQFHPTRGQVLARVLGRSLLSERNWAQHYSDAMATWRVGKAVGDFTARRRSAKVRLGKTSVAKRHAFKKRTVFTTRRRTHMTAMGPHGVCEPNAPSDNTRALRRSGFKTCVSPQ